MTRRVYTPAESQRALELAGDLPWAMVPTWYNRWAKQNGYPVRTAVSLRVHIDTNGGSLTAVGSWLTTGGIARILGLHTSIPVSWAQKYPLILHPYQPPKAPGAARRGRIYIRRDNLRSLARKHPELFAGIAADRLLLLLERQDIVDHILTTCPVRRTYNRPLRCVETGQVFPSRVAAGRALHLCATAISDVLRGRRPAAAGFHFEEVA